MVTGNPTIDALLSFLGGAYAISSALALIPGKVGGFFRRVALNLHPAPK